MCLSPLFPPFFYKFYSLILILPFLLSFLFSCPPSLFSRTLCYTYRIFNIFISSMGKERITEREYSSVN